MSLKALEPFKRPEVVLDGDQKIIPISEAFKRDPLICCCENSGKPWMLDGQRVVSINMGCQVHAENPQKWMARPIGSDE